MRRFRSLTVLRVVPTAQQPPGLVLITVNDIVLGRCGCDIQYLDVNVREQQPVAGWSLEVTRQDKPSA